MISRETVGTEMGGAAPDRRRLARDLPHQNRGGRGPLGGRGALASCRAALVIVAASCLASVCGCATQPLALTREPAAVLLVAADSARALAEELAAGYEAAVPWVTVEVSVYSSAEAEGMVREGAADLAILSWMETRPGQRDLWSAPLRRDAIAIVLHPTTRLPGTSLGHLQEVFRGRLQEWEGVVLVVVSREEGSGTRSAFEAAVMGYHLVTLNAVVASSSSAVISTVTGTPGAIGYVSTLRLSAEDLDGLRILPIDDIPPAPDSIADGSYLLWRQLYLAAPSDPTGEVREFAQWVLGAEGQAVAAQFENQLGSGR